MKLLQMAMESASKFNVYICLLNVQVMTNACTEELECGIVESEMTQRFWGLHVKEMKRCALTLLELFLGGKWSEDVE